MLVKGNFLRRPAAFVAALTVLAGAIAPVFLGGSRPASAATVTARSVQMSRSTPSATGVTYRVQFTAGASGGAGAVLVDFCANSPIVNQTCTAPTDLSVTGATFGAVTSTTGWTISTPSANQVRVNGTAYANSATVAFDVIGVTNSSTLGSFYARIVTYTDNTTMGTNYVSATSVGTHIDEGGVAMSTATDISVSATVMETLTFCTSKTAPSNGCTSLAAPTLTIGHGTPPAIDANAVDTDTAYTQLSTNASSGAVVNLKTVSSATCAGLSRDGGSTCNIAAIGNFAAMSAGTGTFGLNVANGTGGTGTVSAHANYGTTAGSYAMRQANVLGTFGDTIMSSSGPVSNVNSLLTYAATAAPTTLPGVYTTSQSLIATGTF